MDARKDAIINYAPVERLKEVLRLNMLKVGLRASNLPLDAEKAILIKYIKDYYGNNTISEINLAFNMALTGKLDVEVNCYENFSCLYFSSIMNAYRAWASQTTKEMKTELPEPEEIEFSDADMYEWVEHTKTKYLKNELQFNLLPVNLYEFLFNKGEITGNKKEAWQKAKNIRMSELNNESCNPGHDKAALKRSFTYLNSSDIDVKHPEHIILTLTAKRIMLADYFTTT